MFHPGPGLPAESVEAGGQGGLKPEYSTKNASVKVSPTGYVRDLFVSPNARGQGEGTAVMQQVFADADRAGIPLQLHAGEQRTDLPGFYQKLGFREAGKDQFGTRFVRDPVSVAPDYGPEYSPGMVERGNIDYNTRPMVVNEDGRVVANRSIPIRNERGNVLIPTIDDAGRPLSVPDAISRYRRTGEHLGVFRDEGAANDFAAARGDGPVMPEAQVAEESQRRVAANPYYPDRIVNELNSGRRSVLGPVEEKTLVDRLGKLQDVRDAAGRHAMDQRIPAGDRASAGADFEAADAKIRELDHATNSGETLRGRKNQLQWHQYPGQGLRPAGNGAEAGRSQGRCSADSGRISIPQDNGGHARPEKGCHRGGQDKDRLESRAWNEGRSSGAQRAV